MHELNHGAAGKGDKDRSPGWRKNYDEIDWGPLGPKSFVRVGPGRMRKIYSAPPPYRINPEWETATHEFQDGYVVPLR